MLPTDEYLKAVNAYKKIESVKFSRIQRSEKLSNYEGLPLKIRSCYRDRRYRESLTMINRILSSDNLLLKFEANLIRASINARLRGWEYSKEILKTMNSDLILIKKIESLRHQEYLNRLFFLYYYNTSVCYNRLGEIENEIESLGKINEIDLTIDQRGLLLKALVCHYSKRAEYSTAFIYMNELLSKIGNLNSRDQFTSEILEVDLLIRVKDFKKAYDKIVNLCKRKIHLGRERCMKYKVYLEYYLDIKEIINFKDVVLLSDFETKLEIEFIQSYLDQSSEEYKKKWEELKKSMPNRYADVGKCKLIGDEDSLFIQVINKIKIQKEKENKDRVHLGKEILENKELSVLQSKLINYLVDNEGKVEKFLLIDYLWPNQDKIEKASNRLYKTIQRLKQLDIPIEVKDNKVIIK